MLNFKLRKPVGNRTRAFLFSGRLFIRLPTDPLTLVICFRIIRLVKDVTRILTNQRDASGPWPTNRVSALDRALGDIKVFSTLFSFCE